MWEFVDHFREEGVGKDWVSMPQYFKQFGYLTLGSGKLYHPSSTSENIGMPFMDWPASWSPEYPYFFPKDQVCARQHNTGQCAPTGRSNVAPHLRCLVLLLHAVAHGKAGGRRLRIAFTAC